MCPAAVSAAALWLLALLGSGLTPVQASSFPHCSHSFYKQSPPRGSYDGPLRPLCHTRPGGLTFATLYQPTCGSAVYSAFHLSNGLTASSAEEGAEPVSKEERVKVVVPALLKGGSEEPELSPAASHLQQWDSAVTALVQTRVLPQCQTSGGDLYVLIGAGRLGALGDEAEQCQTKLLWAAVCCAAPDVKHSSSVAFIRDTEGEEREVSVQELEAVLGVTELFSEGCGRQTGAAEASQSEAQTVSAVASEAAPAEDSQTEEQNTANSDPQSNSKQTEGSVESQATPSESRATPSESRATPSESRATPSESRATASESRATPSESRATPSESRATASESRATTSEEKPAVAESAKRDQVSPDSEESEATSSESSPSETWAAADSSSSSETVEEQEEDDNSTSTILYILSTTLYILKAPLNPVVNTITELPGQVSYVLQEDLGVLTALPGDTYMVFHLLISDLFSWLRSAFNLVYDVGEACFSRVYFCTSSMGEALFSSCYTGVTGIGTLAGDTWGIFGDVLDNSWCVTKYFGGRLVEQGEDYVGTVVGELGGQASAVGKGFGKLAWNSGNGVGGVLKFGWRFIRGIGGTFVDCIVGDAFEQTSAASEETLETFDLSAAVLPEKTED